MPDPGFFLTSCHLTENSMTEYETEETIKIGRNYMMRF